LIYQTKKLNKMTPTIKVYSKVSETKTICYTKHCSINEIKKDFVRYAKAYRNAYGIKVPATSLQHQINEYTGVTMDQLLIWIP